MRETTLLRTLSLTVALAVCASAWAITFGVPDGGGHPNVGVLVIEWEGQLLSICSGTLIDSNVFLTASHCTAFLEPAGITDVWVSFDPVFDPATATLYSGVPVTNPAYNWRQSDPGDIAVVLLSEIPPIAPAELPALGLLDQMAAKNGLRGQGFTAVGYGAQEAAFGGGPPTFGPGDTRMVSTSRFNALNPAWLRLSQNPATGDGGTCYGDSGGPNFIGDSNTVAAVTVTGDAMCRATNVVYRLDTPSARAFLERFVALP